VLVMLSLRQLKAFVTVAETRSFTKAAKILYLTQPAVSAQLKALEDRLGVQLMERNDKTIMMTEAGQLLYEESQKILSLYDGLKEAIDELRGVRRGKLLLAASNIPGEYILPKLIGDFSRIYPGVETVLKISDTGMVAEELLKKTVDIGIIGAAVKSETLHLQEFISDELIIVSAPYDGDRDKEISLTELVESDFILRELESGTRMFFYNRLKELGIEPRKLNIVMELGSTRAIITAVESGLGISIVSRLAAQDALSLGKIREIKLKNATFHRCLYLAWNKNKYQSYTSRAFIKFIETQKKLIQTKKRSNL